MFIIFIGLLVFAVAMFTYKWINYENSKRLEKQKSISAEDFKNWSRKENLKMVFKFTSIYLIALPIFSVATLYILEKYIV